MIYMQRPHYTVEKAYPEFFAGDDPLLRWGDVEAQKNFLVDDAPELVAEIMDNSDEHFKTYSLDRYGNEYDMFYLSGTSRNTLVTSMEVATNINPSRRFLSRKDRLTHALAVRAFVDPDASLVIQSQSALTTKGKSTMNFSDIEHGLLASGSSAPITARIKETLRQEGRLHTRIHAFGSSLGGMIANDLAGDLDNISSATSLEAPDIKTRSIWELAKEMSASGPHLWENIKFGKLDANVPELRQGLDTLAYWTLSLLNADTKATVDRMQHNTHEEHLLAGLKRNPNMGVVHAWAAKSAISPSKENQAIVEAAKLYENGKFARKIQGIEITSPFASHNSSNIPILMAALVRRAMILGKQTGTNGSIILKL
jgi:hypothetical protein